MSLRTANIRVDDVILGGRKTRICVPQSPNRCWLTSLVTAIGPVAREEIDREMTGAKALAMKAVSFVFEAFSRMLRVDEIVFPEHRLFSTSLYTAGEVAHLLAHRAELQALYPGKAIVIRSLNSRDHATFIDSRSWPFRLVWIVEDVSADWRPRRDSRRDIELLKALNLQQKSYGSDMPEDRLAACLQLYRRLYIAAYSPYNPDYDSGYLRRMLEARVLEFITLEDEAGQIQAFCALHAAADTLSIPLLGYNRDRPQADGLYRAAMALGALTAEARGLRLNLSAGAPHFKRHRGAKPYMEYLLVIADHLPGWRRFAYAVIGAVLRRLEPELLRTAA